MEFLPVLGHLAECLISPSFAETSRKRLFNKEKSSSVQNFSNDIGKPRWSLQPISRYDLREYVITLWSGAAMAGRRSRSGEAGCTGGSWVAPLHSAQGHGHRSSCGAAGCPWLGSAAMPSLLMAAECLLARGAVSIVAQPTWNPFSSHFVTASSPRPRSSSGSRCSMPGRWRARCGCRRGR